METACKDYLNALGSFDYFNASRLSSKLLKLSPTVGTILNRLATCEALYTGLAFLKPKFFRRENFLNILNAAIGDDAIKEAQILFSGGSPTPLESASSTFLSKLCRALNNLATVRQEQINIYRSLSGDPAGIKYEAILENILIVQANLKRMHLEDSLGLLALGLRKELNMLYNIFKAQIALSEYNFKRSTVSLYTAKSELHEWKKACSLLEAHDKHSRPFRNTPQLPNNMGWVSQFTNELMSKLTFYFQDTLLEKERILGGELKNLWRRIEPDYFTLIRNFRRRSGAHSISLIYEIDSEKPFHKKGYVCPVRDYETPTGLMSFPCIYSYPESPPYEHWPNLISIMQVNEELLTDTRSKCIHFYDKKVGSTYYLIRVDVQITLVVIFLDRHGNPENSTVEFMKYIARHLRNTEIFEMMSKME
ncbi:hypothetical protein K7432_013113 [Basidiobolus ranarum]|uniref:Uncharacterized protein n=1 Tax=Basidiobolus ranarum TaxID=34480 RepID=A0ABR2VRB2_9FUNG